MALCTVLILVRAAEPVPNTMTKVVVRSVLPSLPQDSFARLPKTHYRSGSHFARTEEQLDPRLNLRGLIISNMRDTWLINLETKTANHIVDRAETFDIYMPLLPLDPRKHRKSPLRKFEIGNEIAYMIDHKAQKEELADGKQKYTLEQERFKIEVIATTGSEVQPLEVRAYQDQHLVTSLRYDDFDTSLPFKPELFECPEGISIVDAN